MKLFALSLVAVFFAGGQLQTASAQSQTAAWTIDSADDWKQNIESVEGATVKDGAVSPDKKTANVSTKVHKSDVKRSAKSLAVTQSAIWQNWNPVENIGPINLADAPVMLSLGPDNYWIMGHCKPQSSPISSTRPVDSSPAKVDTTLGRVAT